MLTRNLATKAQVVLSTKDCVFQHILDSDCPMKLMQKDIAHALDLSIRTVAYAIKTLKLEGKLKVVRSKNGWWYVTNNLEEYQQKIELKNTILKQNFGDNQKAKKTFLKHSNNTIDGENLKQFKEVAYQYKHIINTRPEYRDTAKLIELMAKTFKCGCLYPLKNGDVLAYMEVESKVGDLNLNKNPKFDTQTTLKSKIKQATQSAQYSQSSKRGYINIQAQKEEEARIIQEERLSKYRAVKESKKAPKVKIGLFVGDSIEEICQKQQEARLKNYGPLSQTENPRPTLSIKKIKPEFKEFIGRNIKMPFPASQGGDDKTKNQLLCWELKRQEGDGGPKKEN